MPSHRSYLNQASSLQTQYETLQKRVSTSPDTNIKMLHKLAAIYKRLGQYKKANNYLEILDELYSIYYPYSARHLHAKSLIVMNQNKVIKEKINTKNNKERNNDRLKKIDEEKKKKSLKNGKKSESNDESNDENEKEA